MYETRALGNAALALLVMLALPTFASASILQPNAGANPDDVFALLDDGASAGSTSAPDAQVPRRPNQLPSASPNEAVLFGHVVESPGHGGSSTSTTPSTGSSGGFAPFMMCAVIVVEDNPIIVRLALCQSLFLPTPPGNDLLRPPRLT
jgi:hypothetical protein